VTINASQLTFLEPAPSVPDGLDYRDDLISPAEEAELLGQLSVLDFREFEFHGYLGKRRVVSFGLHYDFNQRTVRASLLYAAIARKGGGPRRDCCLGPGACWSPNTRLAQESGGTETAPSTETCSAYRSVRHAGSGSGAEKAASGNALR
jgi:hypothetical protein